MIAHFRMKSFFIVKRIECNPEQAEQSSNLFAWNKNLWDYGSISIVSIGNSSNMIIIIIIAATSSRGRTSRSVSSSDGGSSSGQLILNALSDSFFVLEFNFVCMRNNDR